MDEADVLCTVAHDKRGAAADGTTDDRTWRSCCLRTDRQATVYIGQLVFSFSVLGFSASMLVLANGDCNKSSPYIGLISFLMGKLLSTITTT
jgi:hypothetical protein